MFSLSFISEADFNLALQKLIKSYKSGVSKSKSGINKNVLDPFSALLDSLFSELEYPSWLQSEIVRQNQKTLQNTIGQFHQDIICSMKDWESAEGESFDVKNGKLKIIAEIKNKHNTLNAGGKTDIHRKLEESLKRNPSYKGYTAYLVQIVPKSPTGILQDFAPSELGRKATQSPDIKEIDGKQFYDIASQELNTLRRVFNAIPDAVELNTLRRVFNAIPDAVAKLIKPDVLKLPEMEPFQNLFNEVFGMVNNNE